MVVLITTYKSEFFGTRKVFYWAKDKVGDPLI